MRHALIATACLLALASSAQAAPITIGGTTYTAGATSESLNASFLSSAGALSTNNYSGYVLLSVSGFGNSAGPFLNDAFYVFSGGTPSYQSNYKLVVTRGTTVAYGGPGGADNAANHIVFDVDAGVETSPAYVPAYRADHIYNFVLNSATLTGSATQLRFGVNDGAYGDNGGAYAITVTQLVADDGTVPVPASGLLALAALGALGATRRRR